MAPLAPLIHLGGGHDHIYPLLRALSAQNDRITVINIDAHLDTRTDDLPHSGTPFRQFARERGCNKVNFDPIRDPIPFSNASNNFRPLERGQMKCFPSITYKRPRPDFPNP